MRQLVLQGEDQINRSGLFKQRRCEKNLRFAFVQYPHQFRFAPGRQQWYGNGSGFQAGQVDNGELAPARQLKGNAIAGLDPAGYKPGCQTAGSIVECSVGI